MAKSDFLERLDRWYDEGLAQGARYMVVQCDAWEPDWPCIFPKYFPDGTTLTTISEECALDSHTSQYLEELYDLSADKQAQLAQRRVMNHPEMGIKHITIS